MRVSLGIDCARRAAEFHYNDGKSNGASCVGIHSMLLDLRFPAARGLLLNPNTLVAKLQLLGSDLFTRQVTPNIPLEGAGLPPLFPEPQQGRAVV